MEVFLPVMSNFGVPADPVANEHRLRHISRIPYDVFQGVIGAFFGVAVLTVAARMVIRIQSRRRLSLDDYLLLFGLACLFGSTALLLKFTRLIYITEAVTMLEGGQPMQVIFTIEDIMGVSKASAVVDSMVCLTWSATFAVKFSFLALFRLLIRRISKRITIYYWIVVAVTAVTWMFMMSESFIFCSTFGLNAIKCLAHRNLLLQLNIVATVLDITTDIMIISIPILILRKSQMKATQKLGLGVFLCLSIVMILITIIRATALPRGNPLATWQYLWLYLEACIATIMASITAFRTLFVQRGAKEANNNKKNRGSSYSVRERLLRKAAWLNRSGWEEVDREHLPQVPSATLTGLNTFIYFNGRESESSTPMQSDRYSLADEDYQTSSDGRTLTNLRGSDFGD